MGNLKLTSSAFTDGGEIPRECGYKNGNEVPPLTISGKPEGTESLALIMDDPDAMGAVGKVWVHWVIWNINPDTGQVDGYIDDPDAMGAVGKVWVHWVVWNIPFNSVGMIMVDTKKVSTSGTTDFGEVGYGGPAPPDKRHTYVFKLYALDAKLDLPDKSTKADLEKAMEGHIIEQAKLTGTYAP